MSWSASSMVFQKVRWKAARKEPWNDVWSEQRKGFQRESPKILFLPGPERVEGAHVSCEWVQLLYLGVPVGWFRV